MFTIRILAVNIFVIFICTQAWGFSGRSPAGKINVDIGKVLTTPNSIYLKGATLERKGKIGKAIKLYSYLTEKYPNSDLAIKAMDKILELEKREVSVEKKAEFSQTPTETPNRAPVNLKKKIEEELAANPNLSGFSVDVREENGYVSIIGPNSFKWAKQFTNNMSMLYDYKDKWESYMNEAKRTAERIPGVKTVTIKEYQ